VVKGAGEIHELTKLINLRNIFQEILEQICEKNDNKFLLFHRPILTNLRKLQNSEKSEL